MDEEFDAGMGFMDDDMEVDDDVEQEEFEDDESQDSGGSTKKFIIIGIVSIIATVAIILGAVSFLGGGDNPTMEQEEIQQKIDDAYNQGVADTKAEYESQLADKNQEIAELSSQMRKKADEANNMQNRANEASENQQATLEEAQKAIDDIARERDMWRDRAEKAEREQ